MYNIEDFISRLKTVAIKAREEGLSVQAIHSRIKKGKYKTITISGVLFIIEEN